MNNFCQNCGKNASLCINGIEWYCSRCVPRDPPSDFNELKLKNEILYSMTMEKNKYKRRFEEAIILLKRAKIFMSRGDCSKADRLLKEIEEEKNEKTI